jgi:hypothetical protein
LQKPFIKLHHCPVLNLPTASLFVGIATLSITGYIAWQQLQTARNKFRLDLFDRRFPVFEAAMKLVLIAVQEGDISDEARREFLMATRGVEFLFNRKLQVYCDTLEKGAENLHVGYQLKCLSQDEPTKSAEYKESVAEYEEGIAAWTKRAKWFNQQVDEMPKLFGPFLRFRG